MVIKGRKTPIFELLGAIYNEVILLFYLSKTMGNNLYFYLELGVMAANPSSHYKGVVEKKFWACPSDKKVQYF